MDVSDITISLPSQKAFRPPSKIYPGRMDSRRAGRNFRACRQRPPGQDRGSARSSPLLSRETRIFRSFQQEPRLADVRRLRGVASTPAERRLEIRGLVAMERSKFLVKRNHHPLTPVVFAKIGAMRRSPLRSETSPVSSAYSNSRGVAPTLGPSVPLAPRHSRKHRVAQRAPGHSRSWRPERGGRRRRNDAVLAHPAPFGRARSGSLEERGGARPPVTREKKSEPRR